MKWRIGDGNGWNVYYSNDLNIVLTWAAEGTKKCMAGWGWMDILVNCHADLAAAADRDGGIMWRHRRRSWGGKGGNRPPPRWKNKGPKYHFAPFDHADSATSPPKLKHRSAPLCGGLMYLSEEVKWGEVNMIWKQYWYNITKSIELQKMLGRTWNIFKTTSLRLHHTRQPHHFEINYFFQECM